MDYQLPRPLNPDPDRGSNLRRTLRLLNNSTPTNRLPVKILIYGQSYSSQKWWQSLASVLRARFPYADLTIENRALGGFASQYLVHTAEADLYPYYPDCVIFRVLGDHHCYEDIVANIRKRTTAEVLLWNVHLDSTRQEVENDDSSFKSWQWNRWYGRDFIPEIADTYGCELVDIFTEWKQYLKDTGLSHLDFAQSSTDRHFNDRGNWLFAQLIQRRFETGRSSYYDKEPVNEYAIDRCTFNDGISEFDFTGNRIDIIADPLMETPGARIDILIDGKPPSEHTELYCFSRVSSISRSSFPALLRVKNNSPLIAEDWKLRFTKVTPDATELAFEVSGSITGPDGAGNNHETFVSRSGRIVIEPQMWHLAREHQILKTSPQAGQEITWSAVPYFTDTFICPASSDASRESAICAAQGLTNAKHTIGLRCRDLQASGIKALRVYTPPVI